MKKLESVVLDRLRSALAVATSATDVAAAAFDDAPPETVAVERGMAWPLLDANAGADRFNWVQPLLAEETDLDQLTVVDRAGHRRPVYPGLLMYALFQAVRASDRVLLDAAAEVAVRHIDALQSEVDRASADLGREALPAARGDAVAGVAWKALALLAGAELLDDDRAVRSASRTLWTIAARQQPPGGYLLASRSDNPETLWLHELQILHALSSFGLQTRDAAVLESAARAATYHLHETQPDHATNQPWGLPAFLIDPATHIVADAMIHAANVEQPERLSGVTLILLADALYSWRRR